MLFLHLSREKIILEGKGFSEILEYKNIERMLGPKLQELLQKYFLNCIWILNGPGGFTFLRLGCLIVNTIKSLGNKNLKIYESSKLDIYTYAINQGCIPDIGIVFMGQRKKLWCIKSNKKMGYEMGKDGFEIDILSKENINAFSQDQKEYFIDPCEHILLNYIDRDSMIKMYFDGENLNFSWKIKNLKFSIEDLGLKEVSSVKPRYMMDLSL